MSRYKYSSKADRRRKDVRFEKGSTSSLRLFFYLKLASLAKHIGSWNAWICPSVGRPSERRTPGRPSDACHGGSRQLVQLSREAPRGRGNSGVCWPRASQNGQSLSKVAMMAALRGTKKIIRRAFNTKGKSSIPHLPSFATKAMKATHVT